MKMLNLLTAIVLAAVANVLRPFGVVGRAWCQALVAYAWQVASPSGVAFAIFDSQLQFRNTTDSLTQTETSSFLTINGTPADGLAIVIDVPKKSIGDTMQVTLQFSEDGTNVRESLAIATVASVTEASTVPFKIVRRFHTRFKYVRTSTTVAGTSPDFGAVVMRVGNDDQLNVLTRGQNQTTYP
ncbi:MAG: hypothetical protein AB7I04_18470 [Pseudomonadales bacterium]